MESSGRGTDWILRTLGAAVLFAASFGALWYWNTWELTLTVRLAISAGLGVLFLIFGGNVWNWISDIDDWA
jgi:hypothetical protein